MFALAWPVIVAELGWMGMGTVDTIMAGRLGREALGAVSTGNILYDVVAIAGIGLLLGLDTLVSQSWGAGDIGDCHHSVRQAIYMAIAMTPLIMLGGAGFVPLMRAAGVMPEVEAGAAAYIYAVNWGTLPLLIYAALRRYLQGMGLVRPVMFALVSANIVNAFGNWVLMFGNLGAPALGVAGSAWATVIARIWMAATLIVYAVTREHSDFFRGSWAFDLARCRRLLALGMPAAGQIVLEIGVFAAAGVLAGRLSALAVAAHQMALNTIAVTFMVPLGISSAGAVRVGHAIGRGDSDGVRRAGSAALVLAVSFMVLAAFSFFAIPRQILSVYTADAALIDTGMILLYIAAVFQMFDGVQVVATGLLRGVGDTRTPMLTNFVGHWLLGLPASWLLCYRASLGVYGIWAGLSIGLMVVATVLFVIWRRRSRYIVGAAARFVRECV
ncbi:MAG TPA: MATE family efflux transporter [Bryobacteraceae bacterium]|nr:MATE family efflux transporter [Bryobacteraceae bacterium]